MAARYQNLKDTDAGQLTAMRDAAVVLLGHERHISSDVITALCKIQEETAAELKARAGQQQTQLTPAPAHSPVPGQQVSLPATRAGQSMPYDDITSLLIPKLRACRVERVTLTGGEPPSTRLGRTQLWRRSRLSPGPPVRCSWPCAS